MTLLYFIAKIHTLMGDLSKINYKLYAVNFTTSWTIKQANTNIKMLESNTVTFIVCHLKKCGNAVIAPVPSLYHK